MFYLRNHSILSIIRITGIANSSNGGVSTYLSTYIGNDHANDRANDRGDDRSSAGVNAACT